MCVVCAAGGETEEERIFVDILENQLMDNRTMLARLCYNPDFVSPTPGLGEVGEQELVPLPSHLLHVFSI